jgi:hypothetical protein
VFLLVAATPSEREKGKSFILVTQKLVIEN